MTARVDLFSAAARSAVAELAAIELPSFEPPPNLAMIELLVIGDRGITLVTETYDGNIVWGTIQEVLPEVVYLPGHHLRQHVINEETFLARIDRLLHEQHR